MLPAIFLVVVTSGSVFSQKKLIGNQSQEQFSYAKKLLNSFKIDSAKIVLKDLAESLKEQKLLNTEFGMEVLLKQAEAWENDHDDERAISQLLLLLEVSQSKGLWTIYAEAQLSLARLYEKLGQEEKCLRSLRSAQSVIKKHGLQLVYPRFAIRISSYHRVFSGQLDSAMYYAKRAVETVPKDKLIIHEGTGHLLLALLNFRNDSGKASFHFKKAGSIFRQLEDYTGYSYTLIGLSQLLMRDDRFREALAYNDSARVASNTARKMGNQQQYIIYDPLRVRAEIFKELKNIDSSWHYINEAYQMQLDAISNSNAKAILEVEARFNDKLKSQKIKQQERRLRLETQRRNLIIGGLVVALMSLVFILYLYSQLRQSYQLTKQQTNEIELKNAKLTHSLNQQNVLQREVHHRVTNNLQMFISLLELQADKLTDPVAIKSFEAMSNRVWSTAAVHQMLYQDQDLTAIKVQAYVEKLCGHLHVISGLGNKLSYAVDMHQHHLNLQTLIPFGLIINELFTNSTKYATQPEKILKINISLTSEKEVFTLVYRDNGDGFEEAESSKTDGGIGIYLIKSMVRQLKGHIENSTDDGMTYRITFREAFRE